MTTTAIFGSTGLVGNHLLSTILASDAFTSVHTITRRAPKTGADSPKLHATVDADTTKWAPQLAGISPSPAVVFSALGTTRAAAGGIDAQWKIDHDLNVELARAARAAGARTFVFVSSGGTRSALSSLLPYSKMKIGVEDAVRDLAFEQAIILRPGLILGLREVPHPIGPRINSLVMSLGGFGDSFAQEAEVIARAAVKASAMAAEGKAPSKYWVLEQSDIVKFGRGEWKS